MKPSIFPPRFIVWFWYRTFLHEAHCKALSFDSYSHTIHYLIHLTFWYIFLENSTRTDSQKLGVYLGNVHCWISVIELDLIEICTNDIVTLSLLSLDTHTELGHYLGDSWSGFMLWSNRINIKIKHNFLTFGSIWCHCNFVLLGLLATRRITVYLIIVVQACVQMMLELSLFLVYMWILNYVAKHSGHSHKIWA